MSYGEVLPRKLATPAISLAIWAAVALLLGSAFAVTGLAGIFVATGLCVLIVFAAVAARFPVPVMGASIWCLALIPFGWGLQTGVVPKLFGDETMLLFYLAVFPVLYLFTSRTWRPGLASLYIVLALFVTVQSLSLGVATDPIAIRNFIETYVLGALLLVLFLQEGSNSKTEAVGNFVVGITVVIALLTILERITLHNPIMEHEPLYLSPEIARLTEGVYRPYVTFMFPSEAGTFMALGLPFSVGAWMRSKSALTTLTLFTIVGALLVNATRGVWVGVAIAALFALRSAWLVIFASLPVALLGGWISYLVFKASPFFRRLTDPSDLLYRFEYWKIAGRIFVAHPLIGVGHSQFKNVYLDYVRELSNTGPSDIAKVFVADNMFLSTLVEHGLLGLVALLGLLFFLIRLLRKYRTSLQIAGLSEQATFIRCSEFALIIYAATGLLADVQGFTKVTKYIFILVGLGLAEGVKYLSANNLAAKSR